MKYYTKDDIDQMMSDYYTQSEVDQMMSDYYTQLETDILLNQYYSKTDIDSMLTQYYQQAEVDNLISKNKSSIIMGQVDISSLDTVYALFGHADVTEHFAFFIAPVDGTVRNLYAHVPSGALNAGTIVEITVRINSTDTSLALTLTNTDGTDIVSNKSDSATVNKGYRISLEFKETGGVNPHWTKASFLFDADM